MTDFFFYLFRFLFGGAAYCTIELVYRGRTHYSMFFVGMGVWDYSRVPLNLWGQICLPFTLIWLGFSFLLFRFVIPNDPLI